MKLLVATGNEGKLGEFREILAPLLGGHSLVSLKELGLEPPDEPYATFHENAAQKATVSAKASGLWTLADDSGLCVDALDGAPGVFSARYAPTDEERRAKLLAALSGAAAGLRGAHFLCAVALASPEGVRVAGTEGRVDGRITLAARGTNGFGYDPLFEPLETPGQTLAELPGSRKNALSHRGRALTALVPTLARLLHDGHL